MRVRRFGVLVAVYGVLRVNLWRESGCVFFDVWLVGASVGADRRSLARIAQRLGERRSDLTEASTGAFVGEIGVSGVRGCGPVR